MVEEGRLLEIGENEKRENIVKRREKERKGEEKRWNGRRRKKWEARGRSAYSSEKKENSYAPLFLLVFFVGREVIRTVETLSLSLIHRDTTLPVLFVCVCAKEVVPVGQFTFFFFSE